MVGPAERCVWSERALARGRLPVLVPRGHGSLEECQVPSGVGRCDEGDRLSSRGFLEELGLRCVGEGRSTLGGGPDHLFEESEELLCLLRGCEVEIDEDVVGVIDGMQDALRSEPALARASAKRSKAASQTLRSVPWVLDVQRRPCQDLGRSSCPLQARRARRADPSQIGGIFGGLKARREHPAQIRCSGARQCRFWARTRTHRTDLR